MHINNLNTEETENRSWDKDVWGTPLVDSKNACKHFKFTPTLDVCGNYTNQKCNKVFTSEIDAFTQEWDEPFFMNPPYSANKRGKWMYRAVEQAKKHKVSFLVLVYSKTDTAWWHDCVGATPSDMKKHKVEPLFVKGRMNFLTPENVESGNSAPYPNVWLFFNFGRKK